jgi:putative oxidoreductase
MFARFFSARSYSTAGNATLFILRLVVGVAFMLHGWGKIQNPFSWMGPQGFAPAPLQALAAVSEFGGGLALVLGLLTSLGALGIAFTMATAVGMHTLMRSDPFVAKGGGASWELPAVYFAVAIVLIAFGPGRISLDSQLFGPRSR